MKLSLLFLLLWLPLFSSTEKKIIIASFPTQQQADKALTIFESKLNSQFLKKQQQSYFNIVARPSGKTYIIAIEPIESYKEAVRIKKLLPWEYADAFINNYTPPKLKISTQTANVKTTQKPLLESIKPIASPSSEISDATQEIEPVVKANTIKPKQEQTDISHTAVVVAEKEPETIQEPLRLDDTTAIDTRKQMTFFETFLKPEYLLIGMSVIALILLLCFIRYYRKYHHLKKQLVSHEAHDNSSIDSMPKSSDIFFVRQH